MKRRSVYVFVSTSLAMLIPSPGRFVYGLTLVLELNFLILFGLLANSLAKKLKMKEESSIIILGATIFGTILFKEIMMLLNPEIMLTLGFIIYLMPISYFFIGYLFNDNEKDFTKRLRFNFTHMLTFSIYALLFYLVRDIAGYGTITFFASNFAISEKILLNPERIGGLSILATIPGAMILSSLLLFIHITIRNKYNIIKNAEGVK